ncbi:Uma2 family endonuclease [Aurantimonas sp. HBX-1]|uniref:Uma2 family endonuclease n=1 Tax=Aurantimonas sp. HBX-1 TaxID=2906072 RepID=UPI001F3F2E2D|nr:Uma2 family endonuclease [Aurantimonas sp. HBX-1]UIJ73653.1 Uma2 family endonuclease [Aurantimonas sp. HBX-1]
MSALAETRPPSDLPTGLTIAAFFDWLESQPRRYELVDGAPQMQPFVKRSHSQIAGNIAHILQTKIDRSAFIVHQGDFAIQTGPRSIRYADILVEPAGRSPGDRSTDNAVLIVEVLSESTAPEDFGPKRVEYQGLAALRTYLVVDQETPRVWQWDRGDDGKWPALATISNAGAPWVAALNCELPFDEIYFGVPLATNDPRD